MPKGSKSSWWVLTEKDGVFVSHYKGQDKKRAREVAAKHLSSNPKDELIVAKVNAVSVLKEGDLKRHLPKDAF